MADLERAWRFFGYAEMPRTHTYSNLYKTIHKLAEEFAAARLEGAEEMRERVAAALAPIADEEMPEPYWDNARARRMDWACAVGRCLNRVRTLPLTPEETAIRERYKDRLKPFGPQHIPEEPK